MESLQAILKNTTSQTSPSTQGNRCDECGRKLKIQIDGEEKCWYCEVVLSEDKQIVASMNLQNEKQKIINLYRGFEDSSFINPELKKATFNNYKVETKDQINALRFCESYVSRFKGDKPENLFLYGTPGIGKSHLSVSITKELMKKGIAAAFIPAPKIFTKIKETWSKNSIISESEFLRSLATIDCLVIDDIGTEYRSNKLDEEDSWAKKKLFEVIDSRVGRSTIYTSNYDPNNLLEMYGERDFSRMIQHTTILEMYGQNNRMKNIKEG
ncbi:hypothetical protein CN514_00845 [Bacillus sp. AFS001701]|uniref:ATP-binding protein n=1 Tax=Bacillus sp. AFS001701 TaxID=2033480 RepID=UPI000BF70151|nr:ATP-binding protein [Bacillus sp. AFS001701]PET77575.1 hypothetical protein CN514_00845 [Bacillus sp. AFS001701]